MVSFLFPAIGCPSFPSGRFRRLVFAEDRRDLPDGGVAVVLAVDHDDGADGAAAEAGHRLQRELAVLRRLPGRDVELALELLQDLRAAPDVAGRPQADEAGVLAPRLEAEGPVEGGHADDVDEGHAQGLGDLAERFRREVVEGLLDVEEDGDEVLLETLVLVDERLDLGFIGVQIIPPVRRFPSGSGVGEDGRRRDEARVWRG